MNNPEIEPEVLQSKDRSGYSEKQTDLQMDKKGTGGQQVKQFNRGAKPSLADDSIIVSLKKQKNSAVIFDAEDGK